MKSILQRKDGRCYLCMKNGDDSKKQVEEHHVFPGTAGRRRSEKLGLKVYLCLEHHRIGPAAVHQNYELMRMVQAEAQKEYEKDHTHEEWMEKIGRNLL